MLIRELSKEIGITGQQIRNYIDAGCPASKDKNGHWQFEIEEVQAWLSTHLQKPGEDEKSAKVRKLSADASLAKLKNINNPLF